MFPENIVLRSVLYKIIGHVCNSWLISCLKDCIYLKFVICLLGWCHAHYVLGQCCHVEIMLTSYCQNWSMRYIVVPNFGSLNFKVNWLSNMLLESHPSILIMIDHKMRFVCCKSQAMYGPTHEKRWSSGCWLGLVHDLHCGIWSYYFKLTRKLEIQNVFNSIQYFAFT